LFGFYYIYITSNHAFFFNAQIDYHIEMIELGLKSLKEM